MLRQSSKTRRRWNSKLFLAVIAGLFPATVYGQITYLNAFGSEGTGNGQLDGPTGVAVSPTGTVYVADSGNTRVETFSSTGTYQSTFGSLGTGNGEFEYPIGVALSPTGTVYVSDNDDDRIDTFSSTGTFQSSFGSAGSGNGQFNGPVGVAVSPTGTVYVADNVNNRIETFSSAGTFQSAFGSSGSGNGQFNGPAGVAVSPTGTVYVTDTGNNRIETFSSAGTFQSTLSTAGSGVGPFDDPNGVAVSSTGVVYVADTNNNRIETFNSTGGFQSTFGSAGSGNAQFDFPLAVAVSPAGIVYVADYANCRIERFFDPNSWSTGTDTFTDPTVGPTSLTLGTLLSTFTLGSGMGLVVGNTLTVAAVSTVVQSGGSITAGTLSLSDSAFNYQSGSHSLGVITVGASSTFEGAAFTLGSDESMVINGSGASVSSSTLTLAAGSTVTQSNGTLSSPVLNIDGTYTYSAGTFSPSVAVIQPGGELTQASMSNSTVIQLLSGGLLAGTSFTNTTSGQLAGAGLVSTGVSNQGTVQPIGGVLDFTGAFSNTGSVIVQAGSEGLFQQFTSNGGTISLAGGTFNNDGQTLHNTATISGYGILQTGGLSNDGTMAFAGQTSVYGGVTNNSDGLLHLSGNSLTVFNSTLANSGKLIIDAGASGSVYGAYSGTGSIVDYGSLYLNATSVAGPISGNGNLTIGNSPSGSAVVQLAPGSGESALASLTIYSGSSLNLSNNVLVIDYGAGPDPISSIAAWIKTGYAGGAWNGTGIMSTNAQANSASYGIGYADSADPGNPADLASDQIEIKYTLLGDANLDGKVNGADFTILAANFNQSGRSWDQGDFNYDGNVNGADFTLLASNFNQSATQSDVAAADMAALDSFAAANGISLASVPEPACGATVLIAGVGTITRRRRSRRR